MAIQRVSIWDTRYADVTSEDCVGSGYGRWKGILNIPYPVSDFVGKFWVEYDSPEAEVEFANITALCTGIGWHITESDQFDTSGPFDTTNAPGGRHPVSSIIAEMEVEEEESDTAEVLQHSNKNDRLLAEHFTRQLTSKATELTSKIDANTQRCEAVSEGLTNAKFELNTRIDTLSNDLTGVTSSVSTVTQSVTTLEGRVDTLSTTTTSKFEQFLKFLPQTIRWTVGQYTVAGGASSNILHGVPEGAASNEAFIYDAPSKAFKVNADYCGRGRMLQIAIHAMLTIPANYDEDVSFYLTNPSDGLVYAKSTHRITKAHLNASIERNIQWNMNLYIPSGSTPVVTSGMRIMCHNAKTGAPNIIVSNPTFIVLSLI